MRQIERRANRAFFNGYNFKESNTEVKTNFVTWDYDTNNWVTFSVAYFLHGNLIAARDEAGNLYFSSCGWETVTTRSRLVSLGAPCRIKDFQMIRTDTGEAFPHKLTKFYAN